MAYICLTVKYAGDRSIDLALPSDVKSVAIASAVVAGLGLSVSTGHSASLLLLDKTGSHLIASSKTLDESGVLFGSILQLQTSDRPVQETRSLGFDQAVLISEFGQRFVLPDRETVSIGREDPAANIRVDIDLNPLYGKGGEFVSRFHAIIEKKERTYLIKDSDSKRGTYISGKLMDKHKSYPLKDGDKIILGEPGRGVVLIFKVSR